MTHPKLQKIIEQTTTEGAVMTNMETIRKLSQALDICRTALTRMGFGMNAGDSPKIRDEAFMESGRILDSIGDQ